MAGSATDVFEKAFLDYIFRNTSLSLDGTNVWVALFTVAPTDSTTGTEVTGGSYARTAVVRTGAGWDAAAGASPAVTDNTGTVTFPTASASWGTVVAFGITKSSAGALSTDLMLWGDLTVTKVVGSGDTASFAAGELDVSCD